MAGKNVKCTDESGEYNYNAVKKSAGSSKNTEGMETNYSIPGKDMKGKK